MKSKERLALILNARTAHLSAEKRERYMELYSRFSTFGTGISKDEYHEMRLLEIPPIASGTNINTHDPHAPLPGSRRRGD